MHNDLDNFDGPILERTEVGCTGGTLLSRRVYNMILSGFVLLSFVIMGCCSLWTTTPSFMSFFLANGFAFLIGSLVASIGGLVVMMIARSRERLGLALVGYALFTLSFGFTTSFGLAQYSMGTIANALLATAGIMAVFGALGMAFPNFFARIQGVLVAGLGALLIVQLVMMFLGVDQTWVDWVVLLVFCGFIGYDVYRASTSAPTLQNALWFAVEIYLDIINVLLRVLSIIGNRD